MPRALALSPHLDDAAFSCGGTLAALARAGWRVQVATVFTATVPDPQGFALACQTDKGLGPEVDYMALRRGEDQAAMAALGVEPPVFLPFAEAPHRGYHSAKALFAGVLPGDTIGPALGDALGDLLDEQNPDLILAPQAVGGHVDHIQLVEALRGLVPLAPILWWRDFPYTVREASPPEPYRALMELLPETIVQLGPGLLAARRAACLAYASQLGFQFGGTAGLDAKLTDVEPFRDPEGALPQGLAEAAR